MSEDEPISGAVDTVKPWTIKSVATETRDMAISAARKEGLTTGQWLERHVRQWCEEDGFARDEPGQPGSALQLANVRPPDRVMAAGQMVTLAMELAALPPERRTDPVIRAARGTVRAILLALRR